MQIWSNMAPTKNSIERQPSGTGELPPAVIGTGLVALDLIFTTDVRPPVVRAGGTCGNVLSILSYMGWASHPIARLGADPAASLIKRDLRRWDVGLEFACQGPTTEAPIVVQRNKRSRDGTPMHRFSLTCPSCGAFFPTYRAVTVNAAYDVLDTITVACATGYVPSVFFFDRLSRGALVLAEALGKLGALVVFEPIGIGDPKLFKEALQLAHVLKYSSERLRSFELSEWDTPQHLLEIKTCGANGLRYRFRRRTWSQLPAVAALAVVDTAGAGDWCTAGLLHLLAVDGVRSFADLKNADVEEGIRFGQAAAAVACGYDGARGAMDMLSWPEFENAIDGALMGDRSGACDAVRLNPDRHPAMPSIWDKVEKGLDICAACI